MPYVVNSCPRELDEYRDKGLPLFIPFGTVEYHGSQLPLGADIIFPEKLLAEIEKHYPIVIAPTVTCCPNGNAVSGTEKYTIDFSVDLFMDYCYELLKGYMKTGFRHIVLIVHHQGPNIEHMLRVVLAKLTMYEVKNELGDSWWTDNKSPSGPWVEIYGALLGSQDFNAHADKPETEGIMAVAPETVHLEYIGDNEPHWNANARLSDKAHADECFAALLDKWLQKVKNWMPKD